MKRIFTGQPCDCRKGLERDNCPRCETTGKVIDFAAMRKPNPSYYNSSPVREVNGKLYRFRQAQ